MQGLAASRPGRTSNTPWGFTAAEPLKIPWVAQKVDDFLQALLRLVDPGDVLERDAAMGFRQQPIAFDLPLQVVRIQAAASAAVHLDA